MPSASLQTEPHIDPTAHVDPSATLGPGCVIERGAIVGPHCELGEGCRVRPYGMVVAHTTMGARNDVHSFALVGADPQDRKYDGSVPGRLIVGDDNIFREHCTIGRAVGDERPTAIGSRNFFMAAAHVGHNCELGDDIVMANYAAVAGHSRIGNRVNFSGGSFVHQFCVVGDSVMFRGNAMVGMHVPPYVVVRGENCVAGLNTVGLRRTEGIDADDRSDLKDAFRAVYRQRGGAPLAGAVRALIERGGWRGPATRFLRFIDDALRYDPPRARGVVAMRSRSEPTNLRND